MRGDRQDLRARTKRFAGSIIHLYAKLPPRHVPIDIIGRQLLRSGSSVAANYREASRARSRADFVSKIETCLQEADETQLWIELLRDDCGVELSELTAAWSECDELMSIFVSMARNTKSRGL